MHRVTFPNVPAYVASLLMAIAMFVLSPIVALAQANAVGAVPSPSTIVALGESIAAGEFVKDPYNTLMARDYNLRDVNLAVGGVSLDQVIDRELPFVPRNCSIVTVLIGLNDVYPITWQRTSAAEFARSMRVLVTSLRSVCPSAKIVIGTLILDGRPPYFSAGLLAVNGAIRATHDALIVDLFADPRLHDPANYVADRTHPNKNGHMIIAEDFERAIKSAPPPMLISSPTIAYLTPTVNTTNISFMASDPAPPVRAVGVCADARGATIAHFAPAAPAEASTMGQIVGDSTGHCTMHFSDGTARDLLLPVSVYGPLSVGADEIELQMAGPGLDLSIKEPGYFNEFGIADPCVDSAGNRIVHWTKPQIKGPIAVETIVPDHLGTCTMHVYDLNAPAQRIDIPVVVTM